MVVDWTVCNCGTSLIVKQNDWFIDLCCRQAMWSRSKKQNRNQYLPYGRHVIYEHEHAAFIHHLRDLIVRLIDTIKSGNWTFVPNQRTFLVAGRLNSICSFTLPSYNKQRHLSPLHCCNLSITSAHDNMVSSVFLYVLLGLF